MSDSSPIISIGVGGWAYFPLKTGSRLKACAKIYDFIEVNSTFYKIPSERLARKWRAEVDGEFEFSVRASRKLTHENHLEPTGENFKEFEQNLAISKALRAFILHFQFPPAFVITREIVQKWRDFFASAGKISGLNFAIEARNENAANNILFQSFLRDFDIVPTGDPTRGEVSPSSDSKIQYSRIFGPGEHTKWSFSSAELEEVKQKVLKAPATRRYVTFHNITMYEDGARMKYVVRGGGDPKTKVVGLDSLKNAVISERVKYPISAEKLSSQLVWRTIALADGRRVHPNDVLKSLPKNTQFDSLDQILDRMRPVFESPGFGPII